MDKTININIGGTLFQIDEIAFGKLRDYLQALNNRFKNVQGGHETIEDIEFRIAEIFQSQKGLAGVISLENVEAMISIIGKPEEFGEAQPDDQQPYQTHHKKRMYRNPDDKILGGVCSGLGAYLDTDPVLFRVLFVLFTAFFGTGLLLYIVLWIALPAANTDGKKREMFGDDYHSAASRNQHSDNYYNSASSGQPAYHSSSGIGNAFNEIFRAIANVLYVIMRIFMIIIGLVFVLTGFFTIVALLMVFVFRFPWAFSSDALNSGMVYLPDFLNYVVNPALVPWIISLSLIVVILPLLAFIYWGVKMIFWFKAKDWVLSLVASIIWVMAVSALSIILFNEGVSFNESSHTSTETVIPVVPDTLFITTDHKISDLKYDKMFAFDDDEFSIFMVDSPKQIYSRPRLQLNESQTDLAKVEIRKRSSGHTRTEATQKAESLIYNYRISKDTLYLDEYFKIPAGAKWSADFVTIYLSIPDNTILHFDNTLEKMLNREIAISWEEDDNVYHYEYHDLQPWDQGNKFWIFSRHGLKEAEPAASLHK